MPEIADAYLATRGRVRALLEAAGPGAADLPVPATPQWTVHDVVAHLAGVATDLTEGRLDGLATDEWTDAQVARSRELTVVQLLDLWDEHGAGVDAVADSFGAAGGQLLADAASHEHDLRGALDAPGARDSDAVAIGFRFVCAGVRRNRGAVDAPALLIRHEAGEKVLGDREPGASLTTTRFEVLRAATGRRTLDEIRAYEWEGDAHPELLVITSMFAPRAAPLGE
jgi:uncharacterized protein (TIGR03083 family)